MVSAAPPSSDFPSDVLKWIKKNAAPKMALKLMQICKYFQHQVLPFFAVISLRYNEGCWEYRPYFHTPFVFREIDLQSLTKPIWILEDLFIDDNERMVMDLIPKIVVYDITYLHFYDLKNVEFEHFKILTACGTLKYLIMHDTVIKDNDDKDVPLENILQCLPNIVTIKFRYNSNSFVSHHNASKIASKTLGNISLTLIKESFNLEECFKFIQNNQHINFTYHGSEDMEMAETDDFSDRLQALTDELLHAWDSTNWPPQINFYRQTTESKERRDKLEKLCCEQE